MGGGIGNLQTGHLWFVTFIFICYLITPLLQRIHLERTRFVLVMTGLCIVEMIIMLFFGAIGFTSWLPGVFSYMIAYYISGHWDRRISTKTVALLSALMAASLAIRLGTKNLIDGTRLYDIVIVPYTHCILAFWIFFSIYWFCERFKGFRQNVFGRIQTIGKYSFEIYIVHYCLISGIASLKKLTNSILIDTIILAVAIAVMSGLLKKMSDILIKESKHT